MDGRKPTFKQPNNDEERKPAYGRSSIWGLRLLPHFFLLVSFFPTVFAKLIPLSQPNLVATFYAHCRRLFGLIDDYLVCREAGTYVGGPSPREACVCFFLLAAAGAWWFYTSSMIAHIPFGGDSPVFLFRFL